LISIGLELDRQRNVTLPYGQSIISMEIKAESMHAANP